MLTAKIFQQCHFQLIPRKYLGLLVVLFAGRRCYFHSNQAFLSEPYLPSWSWYRKIGQRLFVAVLIRVGAVTTSKMKGNPAVPGVKVPVLCPALCCYCVSSLATQASEAHQYENGSLSSSVQIYNKIAEAYRRNPVSPTKGIADLVPLASSKKCPLPEQWLTWMIKGDCWQSGEVPMQVWKEQWQSKQSRIKNRSVLSGVEHQYTQNVNIISGIPAPGIKVYKNVFHIHYPCLIPVKELTHPDL